MHRPAKGGAAFVVFAPFRLYLRSASLHARLVARLAVMQWCDSAFRVWRILGGGKIRQTL